MKPLIYDAYISNGGNKNIYERQPDGTLKKKDLTAAARITVTAADGTGSAVTTSMTYADILKALAAGSDVVIDYGGKILQLREIGATSLTFGAAELIIPDGAGYVTISDTKIVLSSEGGTVSADTANIEIYSPVEE